MDKRNNYNSGLDDLDRQYQRQLDEFSRMDGTDYSDGSVDLEFTQYDNNAPYRSSRPSAYPGRPQQRQSYAPPRRTPAQPRRNNNASKPRSGSGSKMRRERPAKQNAQSMQPRERASQQAMLNSAYPQQPQRAETARQNYSKGGNGPLEEKKGSPVKKVLIALISITVAIIIILNIVLLYLVGKVNVVDTKKRDDSIKAFMKSDDVKNILVIGSDTRDFSQAGRTDVMIVLSINKKKKQITMMSLMRDLYVPIVGYASDGTKMYNDEEPDGLYRDKLNAAYVYGGAELLMDTIKYNFGLEIDDYIYIDFSSFVDIVDSIDGIELDITSEEAEYMNVCTREQNRVMGNPEKQDYLQAGGKQLLNGNQALSYARLRAVGNADFQRTQRQRIVMSKIIEKVKASGPITKFSFLKSSLKSMTTNMSRSDLFFYGYKAPFYLGYEIKELRIPADDDFEYGTHNGGQSTLDADLDKCRKLIEQNLF